MRLVSVVVPLWLMATTSVSLMSSSRPKPESSVAAIASAVRCEPTNRVSVAATPCAAMAAVP